jgi:hypothetical protein
MGSPGPHLSAKFRGPKFSNLLQATCSQPRKDSDATTTKDQDNAAVETCRQMGIQVSPSISVKEYPTTIPT